MKRVNCFSMLAAAFALTLGVTSCNKNELENGNEAEGQKTYMTVSISFPKASQSYAYATDDLNATNDEAEVKTVDVFIYTAAGTFSTHANIPISNFTQDQGGGSGADKYDYTSPTKIATTTGTKEVFVGLNLPSGMATSLVNKPVSELKTVARTITRAEFATLANGIPMFSTAGVTSTFVADDTDPANKITVNVQRMVAKVTVEKAVTLITTGIPGTFDNFTFAVNNFNTKSFLVQGDAPEYKDPNWDTYTSGDFVDADPTKSTPADPESYIPVVTTKADIKELAARYASENTSDEKTRKELTRVTVRATFVPDEITVYANNSDATDGFKTEPGTGSPATFYSVTPVAAGTSFFYTKAIAEAYAIENGGVAGDAVEYTNGYCYWNIFLNKGTGNKGYEWDVVRNEYFRCTITRVAEIGNPTPDIDPGDEDTSPDTETSIITNINVLFWNTPVLANYVLEK